MQVCMAYRPNLHSRFLHLSNQQSVGSDILLVDGDVILPIVHHFGRRQVDPILDDRLVLLPPELERGGVIGRNFRIGRRVDPAPVQESPSFLQIEAVLGDVPELRSAAAVVRHRPLPVTGSGAEPGLKAQPSVVVVFSSHLDGDAFPGRT